MSFRNRYQGPIKIEVNTSGRQGSENGPRSSVTFKNTSVTRTHYEFGHVSFAVCGDTAFTDLLEALRTAVAMLEEQSAEGEARFAEEKKQRGLK